MSRSISPTTPCERITLDTIDGIAGYVAWRHVWSPRWRTNLYYAMQEYDNNSR